MSMGTLYMVIYGYIPYLVVLIFIAGILYRFISWVISSSLTGLYSVAIMPNRDDYIKVTREVLKRIFTFYTLNTNDRLLFIGSFLFHWGIWVVLIGHLGVILPESVLSSFGITPSLHRLIAYVAGGIAGTMALTGLVILTIRRIIGYEVRVYSFNVRVNTPKISYLDDYFALSILLLLVLFGLMQTLWLPPKISYLDDYFALSILLLLVLFGLMQTLWLHPDFEATVVPWIASLASFKPSVSYIATAPLITQVHVFLAMLFIAYFPWGKMMHPFSFLVMPTITRPAIKISKLGAS